METLNIEKYFYIQREQYVIIVTYLHNYNIKTKTGNSYKLCNCIR